MKVGKQGSFSLTGSLLFYGRPIAQLVSNE